MEEQHLTVGEVAGLLRVSEWTVRRYIQSGVLRATKADGPNGSYRIPLSGYREYIDAHTVTARETR
ncbi:helix-turn-helix domain-containing protein [Micromonospora rifamycinica]|uniref:helix-turn-helix domain-containing protein n=1 Tax=Micromonospora rifamycinica TaxID=291594 RepID=UPI002E2D820E|nr:helix-turn-helix domain-containing protein [Micromonospora rifamycinica]